MFNASGYVIIRALAERSMTVSSVQASANVRLSLRANKGLYTNNGFSVHTKAKHGKAKSYGKSICVPGRRRRDGLAINTILGDGGVPMPGPGLTLDYILATANAHSAVP